MAHSGSESNVPATDLNSMACEFSLTVADTEFRLAVPPDPDSLLESAEVQARFDRDEYIPYWAELWPAAHLLADQILRDWPRGRGRTALEVGCGVGLLSLAAARAGWRVRATDYDRDAVEFARRNAQLNGLDIACSLLDWRDAGFCDSFELILAADVLYEKRNHRPVADLLSRCLSPDGVGLVCDPDRTGTAGFEDLLDEAGLRTQRKSLSGSTREGRPATATLFCVRRARTD